jgi:hypothetical protein
VSFQAYLDNIRAKTGKTPDDFAKLAATQGLTRHGEIVTWLKADFALGHGHANAIAAVLLKAGTRGESKETKLDKLFSGPRQAWRPVADKVITYVCAFGADVAVQVGGTYVSLVRGKKKFAILQPSTAQRLDIGIKLKGRPAAGRFEASDSWNAMVTHRVRISAKQEIDREMLSWLRSAYDAAGASSR